MLRLKPPPEPAGFAARTETAAEEIRAIAAPPGGPGRPPKSAEFDNVWGKYKGVLLAAQHDKCGYCEQSLAVHPGDVEHYAPKAGLQALPADEELLGGEDEHGTYSVLGRRLEDVSSWGYWWLAFEWRNYLAACNRCNSGWKRNLFPVDEETAGPRPDPPAAGEPNEPLLLHPFGERDPAAYLRFDALGGVEARDDSPVGKATIDVCGLYRASLVRGRNFKANRAHFFARQYQRPETSDEQRWTLLKDFALLGTESEPFAGMVRSIFVCELQETVGLSWEEILGKVVRGQLQSWARQFVADEPSARGVLYHGSLLRRAYRPGDQAEILAIVAGDAHGLDPKGLVYFPLPIAHSARIWSEAELRAAIAAGDPDIAAAIEHGVWLEKRAGWDP